ncbi:MAG: glucosamine-6-phosphate deaminase [Bacteroidales bacterium]|nr:glucosamine-6-phosphate deaminase [Bacteroidales bacterium]
MNIIICENAAELGLRAARLAAEKLNQSIAGRGEARLVVSTGSSQFETLSALLSEKVEWEKVEIFHLDEYIGLPVTHPASFRKYLYERFINHIKAKAFHSVDVEGSIEQKIKKLTEEIRRKPVDLGLIGIGVNGHIAFNDPPADFDTREAYIVVNLDNECRMQQVNEGWFKSLEEVPAQAVSMTPWQIMQCKTIISCVPHKVKATAVRNTLLNKVTEVVPATLLKQHPEYHLYIDKNSSSAIIPF